ncbi:MAG TPA: PAS domain-containing protein, partial [Chitinophagaceae bacterium]|nr:PAS domain-containing protein [Chitinophagaceae bacterium]
TRADILGRPLFDAFPDNPDDPGADGVEKLRTSLEAVLHSRQPQPMATQRYDIRNPATGRFIPRFWKPVNTPVLDAAGAVQYIIHGVEDITEKIQLENSRQSAVHDLEESREELRMAIDIAGLGNFRVELPSRMASFSGRIVEWFGLTRSFMPLDEVFSGIHPGDRARVADAIEQSLQPGPGSRHDLTYRVIHPGDGTERHLHSIGRTLFDAGGRPQSIIGMIQDITPVRLYQQQVEGNEAELQRRVAERTRDLEHSKTVLHRQKQLLDMIFRHSTAGLQFLEPIPDGDGKVRDFRIVLANDQVAEFSGFSSLEEFCSHTVDDVHRLRGAEQLTDYMVSVMHTGQPFATEFYLDKQGRWYYLNLVRVETGVLCIITEITEYKGLQQRLQQTIAELQRSNANLEEFAYAASHDMKEPIRKIHFFSDRLREELGNQLSEAQRHLFNRMEQATQRMQTLIDDLLLYSHVSRGAVLEEEIDLNQKVANVLGDLELEIEQKKARVEVGPLPKIRGHRRQLQQLFQNLIGNALKYSKADTAPEISITAHTVSGRQEGLVPDDREQSYHRIEIKDNGIGFHPEDAERIFHVFTR